MIEINGKIYRNIQEQVEKNKDDIEDLNSDITDVNTALNTKVSKDDFGYIYLNSPSGTLTDEQYAECLKEYCVIDYQTNENVINRYYKLAQSDYPIISSGTISFNRCWFGSTESRTDAQGRAYRRVQQFVISVNRSTKAYTVSTEGLYDIYNKSNIDTLLENKIDKSLIGFVDIGMGSSGTFTDAEYLEIQKPIVILNAGNGPVSLYRDNRNPNNDSYIFWDIPRISGDGAMNPMYHQQIMLTVNSDKTWVVTTDNKLIQPLYTLTLPDNTYSGTLTSTAYINNDRPSIIVKDGNTYYKVSRDATNIIYRTMPSMSFVEGNYYYAQRQITVVISTKAWSDSGINNYIPVTDPVNKYQVYLEFTKTGTGAGIYSVYFTVESTHNYGSSMTFSQLRDVIHANGDRVQCTYQTSYSNALNFNLVMQSQNADDPTILIDSTSGDFFEFYSFSDLIDYSITPLQY